MQAPPLRAVVPPLRESRWAPEWQRKILQRELLPLSFYRRLVGCDETEQARSWSQLRYPRPNPIASPNPNPKR
jgi:hypothetical protein